MTTVAVSPASREGQMLDALVAAALAVALALPLFGDWLALSLGRLWTGEAEGWLTTTAAAQVVAVALALWIGKLHGVLRLPETWAFLGFGAVLLAHFLVAAVQAHDLDGYARQKVLAHFALSGPSLLCGIALARTASALRLRVVLLFAAPLLGMTLLALLLDPQWLTIAYYWQPHAYLGVLVLPAHQALAFVLAKIALALHARGRDRALASAPRRIALAGVAIAIGLCLLTGARGYTLALGAALVVLAMLERRQLGWVLVAIAAAWLLVEVAWTPTIGDRFDLQTVLTSRAWLEREDAWVTAWSAFAAAPWLGCGPGGFATLQGLGERAYPHNLLLEVGCELGVVGLTALALVLALACRRVAALRRQGAPSTAARFGIGLFVFALVGAMSVGDLIRNHFLWVAIGVLAASAPGRRRTTS